MIYVYGDSHAGIFWHFDMLPVELDSKSVTMHSFYPNHIQSIKAKKEDVVVFVYGEIDLRMRIGEQVQKGRDANEIIDTLIAKYISNIKELVRDDGPETVIIMHPVPAFYKIGPDNPDFTTFGTLNERLIYHRMLCSKLSTLATENNFHTLSINDVVQLPGGEFMPSMADRWFVHLDSTYAAIIETKLINFLYKEGKITVQKYCNFYNYFYDGKFLKSKRLYPDSKTIK